MKMGIFNEYRGYKGTIEYSYDDGIYFGYIKEAKDLVMYEAHNPSDLLEEFHKAVDEYIEFLGVL